MEVYVNCVVFGILLLLVIFKYALNRDNINPADNGPIYRPIKCHILALFFIGRQKKYNYLVIFFSIDRQFLGFGNRPIVGRRSADKSTDFIFE